MHKLILGFVLIMFQNVCATETFVQFLINDPQVDGYQYRGLQVGVYNVSGSGESLWYAKMRFADIDDNMCSGKSTTTKAGNIVGAGIAVSVVVWPMIKQEKALTWKTGAIAVAGGFLARKAWTKFHEGVGYWDSKVVMRYNIFSDQCPELDFQGDDYFSVKKDANIGNVNHFDDNLLFEWKLPNTMELKDLIDRINSMRRGNQFPHYTLSGLGGIWDAMNCVSFCVRLGEFLGIPFSNNRELLSYVAHRHVPSFSSFRHHTAAKPERIVKAILEDGKLTSDGEFWVKKGHPWWILSGLEETANGHSKAKDTKK